MTVVFQHTVNEVIAKAQKEIAKVNKKFGEFDWLSATKHTVQLVLPYREDSSAFMKVHDNGFIKTKNGSIWLLLPAL